MIAETMRQVTSDLLCLLGPILNAIAVVCTIFICILFMHPPNELVLCTMLLFAIILVIAWFGYAKKTLTGSKSADEAEMSTAAKGKIDD